MTSRRNSNDSQTLDKRVATLMNSNLGLLVTKQRGYLDEAALARQFIETLDMDASERDVVRAIRRHEIPVHLDIDAACALLARTPVSIKDETSWIEIDTKSEEVARLGEVFELSQTTNGVHLSSEKSGVWLQVPDSILDAVLEHLGAPRERVTSGFTRLQVAFPEEGSRMELAAAIVVHVLESHGIKLRWTTRALSNMTFLVPTDDATRAANLVRKIGAPYEGRNDDEEE